MIARTDTALKAILEAEGRTQAWLGRTIGADAAQINRYVHGVHLPGPSTQEAIARALGRPVDVVFPSEPTLLSIALKEQKRDAAFLATHLSARFRTPIYSQQVLSWVRGHAQPDLPTQQAIADVLRRPIDELFLPEVAA